MLGKMAMGAGGAGGGGSGAYVVYNNANLANVNLNATSVSGTLSIGATPPSGFNRYVVAVGYALNRNLTTTVTYSIGGVNSSDFVTIGTASSGTSSRQVISSGSRLLNTGTTAAMSVSYSGTCAGLAFASYSVYVPVGKSMAYAANALSDAYNPGGIPSSTSIAATKNDVLFAIGASRDVGVGNLVFAGDFTIDFNADVYAADPWGADSLVPSANGTYTLIVNPPSPASYQAAGIAKYTVT